MAEDSCSISFRVETEIKDELFDCAKKQDLNVSQIIRRAIKDYLKKAEEEENLNGWYLHLPQRVDR